MVSKKGNSALAVIVVVAVIAGAALWWYWSHGVAHAPASGGEAASSTGASATTLPLGSATDNAALNADLNAVDSQMNGFSSDNANVNGSLSDQPVQQSSL